MSPMDFVICIPLGIVTACILVGTAKFAVNTFVLAMYPRVITLAEPQYCYVCNKVMNCEGSFKLTCMNCYTEICADIQNAL